MADTDEMEIPLREGFEDFPNAHSSQGLLQTQTSLPGGVPHDGDTEMASFGSLPPRPSKRKAKTRSSRLPQQASEKTVGAKDRRHPSAELPEKLPLPKVDLKALFDYHFRRKQRRRRKNRTPPEQCRRLKNRAAPEQKEATTSKTPGGRANIRSLLRISAEERKRRYRERGRQFPFAESFYGSKHVPFRMECLYEQAALQGFFKYIETLKFEHHLKKSLTQMNAGDDLENECLESRKHKYLDDDELLSPIEEMDDQTENSDNKEDIGAKIVENGCFILSSNIPKKKKSKRKTNINDCSMEQSL